MMTLTEIMTEHPFTLGPQNVTVHQPPVDSQI